MAVSRANDPIVDVGLPGQIEVMGILSPAALRANPAYFTDGLHVFDGPPFGLISTVTIPVKSGGNAVRNKLIAERIASNYASRQLVESIFGTETEATSEQHSRETVSATSKNDRSVTQVIDQWFDKDARIRIKAQGRLVGVMPVAKWIDQTDGEVLIHMMFLVTEDDIRDWKR